LKILQKTLLSVAYLYGADSYISDCGTYCTYFDKIADLVKLLQKQLKLTVSRKICENVKKT